ncbi:hypothetical protein IPG41_02865 [Candidatus Peregrinibacteria bacterium]|nr:MAG: hypothetical protein IPG41_02865 [Candidatus Peregrinibacteria bacterium]
MPALLSYLPASLQNLFLRHQKLSLASVGTLLVLAMVGMGTVSLTMLNGNAMNGYTLNDLEQDRQALVEDGEVTDMLSLRARSMEMIEAATLDMVKPTQNEVTYVLPITVVAKNDTEFAY